MDQTFLPEDTRNDENIVRLVQQGQHELFTILVDRYEKKIARYTRKFLSDAKDSEDIVQEVFIKAYRNIQSFDPDRKFSSWLYRIAHNESINFLKKKRVESVPLFDLNLDVLLPHAVTDEHHDQFEIQEMKDLLDKVMTGLDMKYREPLVLYYIEGFDYKEIGDILHIPVATVGVRLNRGKKILKDKYTQIEHP